jgi:hypothetical protein
MASTFQQISSTSKRSEDQQSSSDDLGNSQVATMMDQRASTVAQNKSIEGISNSPQTQKIAQLQAIMNGSTPIQKAAEEEEVQMKAAPIQKAAEEEELMQGKFNTVQKAADEEEVQMKAAPIQKVADEEEPMQGKFNTVQKVADEEEVQMKAAPVQKKENNTGLPDNLKSGVEKLSGESLDDVQVHRNSAQPAQMQAHAFAQGNQIHVAPGQEKHLPHEAWHVAQQKQGRVKPTTQMKGKIPVNDDKGLEHEADVMGAKALELGNS